MGRIGTFILGFLLGGATVFGSLHFHLVYAPDGLHAIPKMSSTFADTIVDIREFGFDDWNEHRALVIAITQSGKTHLLPGVALQPVQNAVDGMRDILSGNR